MKFKGIIFDLDGTVADTGDDLSTAMNLMLESFGFGRKSREEILKHINFGAKEFVRGCLPDEKVLDEALIRYKGFYAECYLEKTYLYDGISELVESLHENGINMCVLSNKQDDMTKKIIMSLLNNDYFVEVLGGSERFPHKPKPDSALYLADKMGVKPCEILYIGDSDVDMKTAVNAGMFPLGVTWGYRPESVLVEAGAEKIVHSPGEIGEFVV
jgi:phosphoglycolate phosphatase